jgi:hypothetical protein
MMILISREDTGVFIYIVNCPPNLMEYKFQMPSQLRVFFYIQTKLIFQFESQNCISEVPLVKLILMHKIL